MKRAALWLAGILGVFVAITIWTLQTGDIATVETRNAVGDLRSTSVWYADMDGQRWLEAGAPENGWFRDLRADPHIRLTTRDGTHAYRAQPVHDVDVHGALRKQMRARYGFRDQWVGMLVDHEVSVPVRLVPIDTAGRTP